MKKGIYSILLVKKKLRDKLLVQCPTLKGERLTCIKMYRGEENFLAVLLVKPRLVGKRADGGPRGRQRQVRLVRTVRRKERYTPTYNVYGKIKIEHLVQQW